MDADAFLAAIRATPADDLPRLAYADWLDENGEPEYAAYIRLACRRAAAGETTERFDGPGPAAYLAWEKFAARHPAAFAGTRLSMTDFPRGICNAVTVTADEFLRASPHWWPFVCPESLMVNEADGQVDEVMAADYLDRVVELCLGRGPAAVRMLRAVAAGGRLGRLRGLRGWFVPATPGALAALRRSPVCRHLAYLDLQVFSRHVPVEDGATVRLSAAQEPPADNIGRAIDAFLAAHGPGLVADPPALPPAAGPG